MSSAEPVTAQAHAHVDAGTVESLVRSELSKALGGVRGMIEAAIPTIAFTVSWLGTHNLKLSLIISGAAAVVLLVARIIARQTPQFVLNALVGIAVAAVFALRSGKAADAFLPGILLNSGAALLMILSILARWPFIGIMIGSATGDPVGWRSDPAIVRLCSKLTWIFVLPNIVRVAIELPLYLGDQVGALGVAKIVLGWPLFVAVLIVMLWVLARGRTPLAVSPASST